MMGRRRHRSAMVIKFRLEHWLSCVLSNILLGVCFDLPIFQIVHQKLDRLSRMVPEETLR